MSIIGTGKMIAGGYSAAPGPIKWPEIQQGLGSTIAVQGGESWHWL